jgi:hypothetical protein
MNKFAFFFPAKIIFAESSVELTPYEGKHLVYLGPIGRKYYLKTDKGKIVFEHIEDDKRQLFVKVRDCFCPFHVTFIDNIPALMESINETCDAKMTEWEAAIDFPEVYEQKAAESREKAKAEREQRDKDEAERKTARAVEMRKAYENTLNNFKNNTGVMIWDTFEEACKEYNVKIPIKTIGYGRKNIISVSQTGMTTHGKCHNSPVLWAAIRELAAKLV